MGSHPVSTTWNRQLRNLFLLGKERGRHTERSRDMSQSTCSAHGLPVLTSPAYPATFLLLASETPCIFYNQSLLSALASLGWVLLLEIQSPNIVMNRFTEVLLSFAFIWALSTCARRTSFLSPAFAQRQCILLFHTSECHHLHDLPLPHPQCCSQLPLVSLYIMPLNEMLTKKHREARSIIYICLRLMNR